MLLAAYVERYALETALGPRTVENYRGSVARFSHWLGHPARMADLTDDAANRWLVAILDRGRSPKTAKNERNALLALWRAAYESRLVERRPDRIRKIRVPVSLPEAWDERQLVALLAVAALLPGKLRRWRLPKAAFFRALILAGYDSGLRLADLLALRWDQIGADGSVAVLQQKTRWPILARLRPETLAALDQIGREGQPLVFGGVISRRQLFAHFGRLVRLAGLSGGTRKLRRSGASLLERVCPGAAQYYLGHRGPNLAARYYIDPRVAGQNRPLPPPLAG